MKQPLHLRIPTPCHEDWAAMKPADKGRFCLSCQKTVVDFSSMTDRQLLDYFSNYTGNTCGRFHPEQLNRDITAGVQKPTSWYKYVLSFFVPALLVANKSMAQGFLLRDTCHPKAQQPVKCKVNDAAPEARQQQPELTPYKIEGRLEGEEGTPVPFATVMIKGTKQGVTADMNGKFQIRLLKGKPTTLVVSCVGYQEKEVYLDTTHNAASPVIVILVERTVMDNYGVLVTVPKKPKQTIFHKFGNIIADSIGKKSLLLYPNAAKPGALVHISYKTGEGKYYIHVLSSTGQVLQEEIVHIDAKVDMLSFRLKNHIIAGQYIVAIMNRKGKTIGTGKLIVQ
ncbi:MAG TPA: carboxypeptidase-like regulatory domain-containing protein [Chitinophagaceae bacterium]|nr:carboxypeptidase-like regulatory domain-containing protein [Chitinophagaceae bacterium]